MTTKRSDRKLIRILKEGQDVQARLAAAWYLGQIGSTEAVPILIRILLEDPVWNMRQVAAHAIGQIRDPMAVPALIQALQDPDGLVRKTAAEALGQIGDPRSVPALVQALGDWYYEVCEAAARALGQFCSPEVVSALTQTVQREQEWGVFLAGVLALGQTSDTQSALIRALREDPDGKKRTISAWALGQIRSPEAIPALTEALRDPNQDVRAAAAAALGRIGDPRGVPSLAQALQDSYWLVRLRAAEALCQTPEGVLALLKASGTEWMSVVLENTYPETLVRLGLDQVMELPPDVVRELATIAVRAENPPPWAAAALW